MKKGKLSPLIAFVVIIIGVYFETFVAQQLFTEYNQSESFQTIGVNGLYGCVLGIAIFMGVMRLCLCLNMLMTPQINYLKTKKHDRKAVFSKLRVYFIGTFLCAILPALIVIWQYATTAYGTVVFGYLFAVLITFMLSSLLLYRPFLYPRIDDIVQSYCCFLALFYFTFFLPLQEQNKTLFFNLMSILFVISFIWFVITKGLFVTPSSKFQFKEKIYQVSRERGSTYLKKYIVRTGTMPLKVSRKYGYFAMHTTYYAEKNIAVISKWKQDVGVTESCIICDIPFYEELRKAKLEYRIGATIIVITDGENKFDMLPHLPEDYHAFTHNFLQYT